jgi:hypothetical protein
VFVCVFVCVCVCSSRKVWGVRLVWFGERFYSSFSFCGSFCTLSDSLFNFFIRLVRWVIPFLFLLFSPLLSLPPLSCYSELLMEHLTL